MKKIIFTLVFSICLLSSSFVSAEETAIVGGKIVVGNGEVIENGIIIIDGKRIVAVGVNIDIPSGARRIDATGMVVWPGMIDPFTSLGLTEVSASAATRDANERTAVNTSQLRAIDGINPDSEPIAVTRINGITTVLVSPGTSNPINGQAAIINLAGRTVAEMLVKEPVAVILGFDVRRSGSYPSTRPGTMALIRQTLFDAKAYGDKKKKSESKEEDENAKSSGGQKVDLKMEILAKVCNGELPVMAMADTTQSITNALALAKEFGLRMILVGAQNSWKMLDEIKASGFPLLLSATFRSPGDRDPYDRYYKLGSTIHNAGIKFAFSTGSNHSVRALPEHAALAVTFGLPKIAAIKALTIVPAQILGIDKDYGSIEQGKIANIAVWNACPLQITSQVKHLFINGDKIELTSRQELLRDKFNDLRSVK